MECVMKYLQKFILSGSLLSASNVMAHEGHGSSQNGLWHYLIEPVHLYGIAAILLGLIGIVFFLLRLRRQHRSG
jgi:hypothetical protein